MTPEDAAAGSADAIAQVGGFFMLDPSTYQRGGELGFDGMTFYVAGRGGSLGEVSAEVVAASFVFFAPELVAAAWDATAEVMSRRNAAEAFAAAGHEWARKQLGGVVDDDTLRMLGDLAERIVHAASPAGAPLFAAWRALPTPEDAPARLLHHLNALRELRNAYHGGAVLAAGLTPEQAVHLRSPQMAPLFGWTEPTEDVGSLRGRWNEAEEATNKAMATVFSELDDAERAQFVQLAEQIRTAGAG